MDGYKMHGAKSWGRAKQRIWIDSPGLHAFGGGKIASVSTYCYMTVTLIGNKFNYCPHSQIKNYSTLFLRKNCILIVIYTFFSLMKEVQREPIYLRSITKIHK